VPRGQRPVVAVPCGRAAHRSVVADWRTRRLTSAAVIWRYRDGHA
jgi:hypothetical protein